MFMNPGGELQANTRQGHEKALRPGLAPQALEQRQPAGEAELFDGACQGVANARQFNEAGDAFDAGNLVDGTRQLPQVFGSGSVSLDAKHVGALRIEQLGHFFQAICDLLVGQRRRLFLRLFLRRGHVSAPCCFKPPFLGESRS
jgi:hypothetical protein